MSVERRKNSKFWYGRLSVGGRPRSLSLRVEVKGEPPAPGQLHGDSKFERSKREAEAALERVKHELRSSSDADLLKRAYELKTNAQIPRIGVRFLYFHFRRALGTRGRRRSRRYLHQIASKLRGFGDFLQRRYPAAETLLDVTEKMADDFLNDIDGRYAKASTYNHWLKDIRSAIGRILKHRSLEERNPLKRAVPRSVDDSQSRVPFSEEELDRILKAAKKEADQDTYDVIAIAACTGMRRADCCYLTWDAVDLGHAMIETKTHKTNKPVLIPILPLLGDVLSRRHAARADGKRHGRGAHVIPAMGVLSERNLDIVTDRTRKILLATGFDAEQLHAPKVKGGHRAVCLRGFGSLRATFTTLALNAGIPIELVRKVTGHTTDEIVRTHYHNPSRENLSTQFQERMPSAFGTKGAAVDKISRDLRTWLYAQLDQFLAKGVPMTVAEIKARLERAMVV